MTSSYGINPNPFPTEYNRYVNEYPDFVEKTNEEIDENTKVISRRYEDFIAWNNQHAINQENLFNQLLPLTKTGKQVFEGVKNYQDYLKDNATLLEAMQKGGATLVDPTAAEQMGGAFLASIETGQTANELNQEGLHYTAYDLANNPFIKSLRNDNLNANNIKEHLNTFWPIMTAGLKVDVSAFDPDNPFQTYNEATNPAIRDYIAQQLLGTYLYLHKDQIDQSLFHRSQIIENATEFYNNIQTANNQERALEISNQIDQQNQEAFTAMIQSSPNPTEMIVSTIETIKGDRTWAEARDEVGLWLSRIAETNAVDQSKLYDIIYEQTFTAHDGHVTTIAELWPDMAARILNAGAKAWEDKDQENYLEAEKVVNSTIIGATQNIEEGTILSEVDILTLEKELLDIARGQISLAEIRQLPAYLAYLEKGGNVIEEGSAIQQLEAWNPLDGMPPEILFRSIRDREVRLEFRKKFDVTDSQEQMIESQVKAFAKEVDPDIDYEKNSNVKQLNIINNLRRIFTRAFTHARSTDGGNQEFEEAFQYAYQATESFIKKHQEGNYQLDVPYDPQGPTPALRQDVAQAGDNLKNDTTLLRSTDPWIGETGARLQDALEYLNTNNVNSDGYNYYNWLAEKRITITGPDGINSVLNTRQLIQARLKALNLLDGEYQPIPEELLSETAKDLLTISNTPGRTLRAFPIPDDVEVNGDAINTGDGDQDAAVTALHTTSKVQGIDAHGGYDAVLVGSTYIDPENNNLLEKPLSQYTLFEVLDLLADNPKIKQLGIYGITDENFFEIINTLNVNGINTLFDAKTQLLFLQEKLRLNANKGSELSTLTNNSRRLVTIPPELHQQYIAQVGKQGMNDLKFLTPAAARYMIENPASTLIT